ncbi:DUF2695 domain-containing protein [Vreelandella titanicae]|jgi:hypothetical protein|nr:DUF2695 domain-containing protein [Halomonas titanicae]|tara:strand:+ start:784 stop:1275 length:492 start_codon:yes stop_codon:yes gene_type:complete
MFGGLEAGALKAHTSYYQQLKLWVLAMAVNKPRQRKYFASLRSKRKNIPLLGALCVGEIVASKQEKRRRAALVEAMVAEDTKEAIENMPLSLAVLGELFDYLDETLEQEGCDHSPRATQLFLSQKGLDPNQVLPWLEEQGGNCDCEILANVEESWESEISKNT